MSGNCRRQVVGLIRCNEIERVASGEFLAFVMDCSGSQTFEAQAHGSPVEHVIPVDGAMLRHRMLTVPKNAEHPNAAKLFTTFMLTKEAQKQLWDSDFSDMYLFPESQMGQSGETSGKTRRKIFRADGRLGRRQPGDRRDFRRDGEDHDAEVTERTRSSRTQKKHVCVPDVSNVILRRQPKDLAFGKVAVGRDSSLCSE